MFSLMNSMPGKSLTLASNVATAAWASYTVRRSLGFLAEEDGWLRYCDELVGGSILRNIPRFLGEAP